MKNFLRKEGKYNYLEYGEGEPIIFLHGLMGGLSNFKKVTNYVAKHNFRVIIPELPIYTMPLLRSNVRSYSRYLDRFLTFKGLEKVTLLGNSLGGHIALYYHKLFKNKVKQIVLTGSSGLYENSMSSGYPKRGDYEYVKRKTEDVFYDSKMASKELVDEVFEIVNDRHKLLRTLSVAKSAIRHNMTKDLPKIKVPTCIIWGKDDSVTPPSVAKEFHNLIPLSSLYWIKKCGHAPMMERPKKFSKILVEWLSKQN